MKYLILILFLTFSYFSFAQIKFVNLEINAIPKTIKFKGKIVNAVKYTDNEGENIVITTQTGVIRTNDGLKNADLYAYNYKINGDSVKLTWQMHDFIKDCELDVMAKYLPNSFGVTDLDNNGKAEIWIMYKTTCTGDVSPLDMKIIMHENGNKFAMRGTNRVKGSGAEYSGGNYKFDQDFLTGPESFRQYAKELWKKNLMETWK